MDKNKYKKIQCIYSIYNKKTHRVYIGSSGDFARRINSHLFFLENNKHHSPLLQKDYNKYGVESFSFSVLERCKDHNHLLELEQSTIDTYSHSYELYNERRAYWEKSGKNKDERRFIDYINTNWLVPIGCSGIDSEKYRIYKEDDKKKIVDMAFDCDLFRTAREDLTFNRVVRMLRETLGYEVVSGRFRFNYKQQTYKLVLSYDGTEPKDNLIYL